MNPRYCLTSTYIFIPKTFWYWIPMIIPIMEHLDKKVKRLYSLEKLKKWTETKKKDRELTIFCKYFFGQSPNILLYIFAGNMTLKEKFIPTKPATELVEVTMVFATTQPNGNLLQRYQGKGLDFSRFWECVMHSKALLGTV